VPSRPAARRERVEGQRDPRRSAISGHGGDDKRNQAYQETIGGSAFLCTESDQERRQRERGDPHHDDQAKASMLQFRAGLKVDEGDHAKGRNERERSAVRNVVGPDRHVLRLARTTQ